MPDSSTPASQMIRVPTPLIEAVKELSRLHRQGHTRHLLTGLQQLIATIDSSYDSNTIYDSSIDSNLISRIMPVVDDSILEKLDACVFNHMEAQQQEIARQIDARIAGTIAVAIAPIQEEVAQLKGGLDNRIATKVDECISTQLVDVYEQIHATQASIELQVRKTVQQAIWLVEASPEVLAKATTKEEVASPAIQQGEQKTKVITITPNTRLKQFGLARRFGHLNPNSGKPDNSRISRKQLKPDFEEWSREQDPEGIAWNYDALSKLFSPVISK